MNIEERFYCSRCMREIEDEESICPHCGYDPYQQQNVYVLQEGTLLNNSRYQLGAVIGSGGFGITYAAWDIVLNQPVAVKEYYRRNICERDCSEDDNVIINPGMEGAYQKGLDRFIREARILGTLQNVKNIVPVLEWFEANNTAYIVMKYIHGVNLEDYVKKNNIKPQKLIAIMRDIIDSLVLIHAQGIIHRDISPSNIMVQEDGTMILIDFGAASLEEQIEQGRDKTAIYNRRYAPVEQYDESGMQGSWTDVYALSATLYHMICGEPPIESVARTGNDTLKSPRELKINLKKYQNKAIMEGLALQPEKRVQTMAIFRSMLYDLPMPEEVIRRRRFMIRVVSFAAVISIMIILAVINFAFGFFLGDGIRYSLYRDGFHIRGFSSDSEAINLPSKIAGINITQIDDGAFQGAENLRSVSIPGSIKTISRFAFNSCKNLMTVTLNEGVKKLSSESFANCENLQAVITPDSLNEIDPDTFSSSGNRLVMLGRMNTPASELARELNINYAYIETINNDSGITITKYETEQNNIRIPDYINNKPVTKLESGREASIFSRIKLERYNIVLPKYLASIGSYAFYKVPVTEIELPGELKHIGRNAFTMTQLESINIPDSVVSVEPEAFSVITALRTVKLSSGMKDILYRCFEGDMRLENIIIPEGIEKINLLAFNQCSSLKEITLPLSLKLIGNFAFMDCTSLNKIFMSPSLENINDNAFTGCTNSLTMIGYEGTLAHHFSSKHGFNFYPVTNFMLNFPSGTLGDLIPKFKGESDDITIPPYFRDITIKRIHESQSLKVKNLTLPKYLEGVANACFYGNNYLESISCPASLKSIGTFAFGECLNLRRVNLNEGLEIIDSAAFALCPNLSEIRLPDSVNKIGSGAFEKCTSLKDINIPSNLVILDNDTFAYTGLESVKIPGNAAKCGTAFYGCKDLREVIIEEGVRTLWGTFAKCEALRSVIIPSSLEQISRSTFMECKNLQDIWIYSDNIELDYVGFGGLSSRHIEHYGIRDGHVSSNLVFLESDNNTALFTDCPNLTIHAHRGSSAHLYATTHNIKFSAIPDDKNNDTRNSVVPYKRPERLYSDEELPKVISPAEGDDSGRLWEKFRYALGYGLKDIAHMCLDAYIKTGGEHEKIWGNSAKLFLDNAEGYTSGEAIAFFEDYKEHPVLKAGDIIVEVDGAKFMNYDEFTNLIKKAAESGSAKLTILRADNQGILRKLEVIIHKGEPFFATMSIAPKTFEDVN